MMTLVKSPGMYLERDTVRQSQMQELLEIVNWVSLSLLVKPASQHQFVKILLPSVLGFGSVKLDLKTKTKNNVVRKMDLYAWS